MDSVLEDTWQNHFGYTKVAQYNKPNLYQFDVVRQEVYSCTVSI